MTLYDILLHAFALIGLVYTLAVVGLLLLARIRYKPAKVRVWPRLVK